MKSLNLIGLLSLFLIFSACDITDESYSSTEFTETATVEALNKSSQQSGNTILDIAASNEDFSILAQAVQFAGLEDELSGRRQYTVFAPTNDAFVNLLGALELTAEEFFVEENKGLIKDVLLYHVAPGNRDSGDVTTSTRIRTAGKSFIFVKEDDGSFFVGNEQNGFAQIIAVDIFARNGVIHVIDAVMLP
jgi:transforming growth factor-beta-induced protein